VELNNATLTNIKGEQAKNPDLTITLNRADLNMVMMGVNSFDDLIKAGKAKFDGDRKPFDQLRRNSPDRNAVGQLQQTRPWLLRPSSSLR
jgi:alkyl sulfatase BDS1-like metallo-beta-lactamase superfamily hydrolase